MQSDLSSSLAQAKALSDAMDVLSRIPSIALGNMADVPRGTISGVALDLLFQPLVELTESKRRLDGDMLEELNRRLLCMAGYGDAVEVTVTWPNMVPVDALASAQEAQLLLAMGVSKQSVFAKLGYDFDAEQLLNQAAQLPPTATTSDDTDPQIALTTDASLTNSDIEDNATLLAA